MSLAACALVAATEAMDEATSDDVEVWEDALVGAAAAAEVEVVVVGRWDGEGMGEGCFIVGEAVGDANGGEAEASGGGGDELGEVIAMPTFCCDCPCTCPCV